MPASRGPVPAPPPGPRYLYHDDAQYRARLKKEVRGTWYHVHKDLEPRGFCRQDKESGPSGGDLIVTKDSMHRLASRAFRDLTRGEVPDQTEMDALEVIVHEHTHCLVRLLANGEDHPDDVKVYSHPDKAVPAILHAFGPNCLLGVNAFTGALRWRPSPRSLRNAMMGHSELPVAWLKGLAWFAQHLDDKPTKYPAG